MVDEGRLCQPADRISIPCVFCCTAEIYSSRVEEEKTCDSLGAVSFYSPGGI